MSTSAPEAISTNFSAVDFGAMTADEQRAFFDEYGFLVVPGAVPPAQLATIREDITHLNWREREDNFWSSPATGQLVENPAVTAAVRACYGPDIRFFKGVYVSRPPAPRDATKPTRQGLHLDYGTRENEADMRNNSPSWVNVGFYFTNLTPDHGPLWVVPGSNRRYDLAPGKSVEHMSGQAQMILAKAGDAVLFHCFTAHAGGYNFSDTSRDALFLSYRPKWAQLPTQNEVWPDAVLASASPELKRLLTGAA